VLKNFFKRRLPTLGNSVIMGIRFIILIVVALSLEEGLCLECYECPISSVPGSANTASNVCFNKESNLDITNLAEHIKDCRDDQVCMYQSFKNEQNDGRLEKMLVIRRCLDLVNVPQDHLLGTCNSGKIPNTSTHKKECYCKTDLCNKDHRSVDKPTTTITTTTITTTTTTTTTTTKNPSAAPPVTEKKEWHYGYTVAIVVSILTVFAILGGFLTWRMKRPSESIANREHGVTGTLL